MPATPKKTEILHVRVDVGLADALRELAAADERKLSPFVARVLRLYVAEHGPAPAGKGRKP